jgi:outer membrane protein
MKAKIKTKGWIMILLIVTSVINAQSTIDSYIKEGLKNNIILKQKNIGIENALTALKEAKGLFLPSVNFNSSYQSGEGGRFFSFPVGDLINPVYSTLNQLTGTNDFPQLQNIKTNLNPNNYYDTHIRTSVPLINTDIYYNLSIEKQQITLSEKEVALYKRELVKNIKTAYYNYLMAESSAAIYESAVALVNKNLKVNQSLNKNGSGLYANVNRAQAEVELVKSQVVNAKNQLKNAQYYLNFLLNKGLEENILTTTDIDKELDENLKLQNGTNSREEIELISLAVNINETALKMDKNYWIPKINGFIDLGSQGTDWTFDSQSKYYFAGVQMDIPVFNGFKNSTKIKQRKLELDRLNFDKENISKQVDMTTKMAVNELDTANQELTSAKSRTKAAESYFKVLEAGYNQGTNSLIEFIDARNQLTQSQLQNTLAKYKVLQALTEVERQSASYNINQN